MLEEIVGQLVARGNYWASVVLMMIGLWGVIAKNNLFKKVIGLVIFQTSIILFYVSIGVKNEATIPILEDRHIHHAHEHHEGDGAHGSSEHQEQSHHAVLEDAHHVAEGDTLQGDFTDYYANPLPHVLMLTAIVVGVGTLGVALALIERIFYEFDSIEEPVILEKMSQ